MKNKAMRGKIIFVTAAIFILAIAAFIYKQPVEIEEMYKDWDFDECVLIRISADYDSKGEFYRTGKLDQYYYSLEKGNEGFEEIIALFDGRELTRSLKSAKANEGSTNFQDVNFMWDVSFFSNKGHISFNNYVGKKVTVTINLDDVYRIDIDKNDPWLREVLDNIIKYEK